MNHRSRFLPVKPKNKVGKTYTSLSSVYEKVVPVAVKQPSQIAPEVVPDYINDFTKPVKEKSVKKGPVEVSEAQTLFGKMLPHQKRMMLEEMALHEHSASSLNSDSGLLVNYLNLITNSSFETGDFTGWTTVSPGGAAAVVTTPVYEGTYAGRVSYSNGSATVSQTVTIPDRGAILTYYYYPLGSGVAFGFTWGGGATIGQVVQAGANAWFKYTYDMTPYAGQTKVLAVGGGRAGTAAIYIDKVSLIEPIKNI